MVGCTNVEDASNTDVETDIQEVTTVETNGIRYNETSYLTIDKPRYQYIERKKNP